MEVLVAVQQDEMLCLSPPTNMVGYDHEPGQLYSLPRLLRQIDLIK
jgi:hypothetical protein